MKKLSKKTIQYTAENGRMLLYLAVIMELAAGICALAYGIIRYNGWMMAAGLLLNSISMFSAIFTKLAPKGEKIIVVTENRFYLSAYAGLLVNKHDFSWIDKVELLESRQKKTLIIYTNDVLINSESHGFERRFVEKNLKLYGAPIAVSDSELLKIGVSSVDLEELCETINANQIMEKIKDFSDTSLLSTKMQLPNKSQLYMVGSEAQISGAGMLIKPADEDCVLLFPDSELDNISVMVSNQNEIKETVIILLYKSMDFLLVASSDNIYKNLFDALTNMRGFDVQKFNEAYRKAENVLCRCFFPVLPSKAETASKKL